MIDILPDRDGWAVRRSGVAMTTPAGTPMVVPSRALADAVADEARVSLAALATAAWARAAAGARVDNGAGSTGAMAVAVAAPGPQARRGRGVSRPMTGLAGAALDRMGAAAVGTLAAYGDGDMLLYRAAAPETLTARQRAAWDPPLLWASARYDVVFETITGVIHSPQPLLTRERLRAAVTAALPWERAALWPVVTVTGSLVLGLALLGGAIDAEGAWAAGETDAAWQAEQWGDDPLAHSAREERRAALMDGARFLELLRAVVPRPD